MKSRPIAGFSAPVRFRLKAALIVALVVAAYWPVTQAGFIWDDDDYVVENQALRTADGLRDIWLKPGTTRQFYPAVHTTFWVEHWLWGLRPAGYHVVNVLLHAANALLLWQVLRRLGVPGSWLAAAIFAVHPIEVESVAWVTERKNVLSGFFYLAGAIAYLRFSGLDGGPIPGNRWKYYSLSLILLAGALLSKSVTCSLPAVLLVVAWWKRGKIAFRRDVAPLIPFFLLGAAMGLMTVWMEKHHVGAVGPDWALSFADRCIVASRAVWFYVFKLVWPDPLIFIYPRWRIDSSDPLQYRLIVGTAAVIAGLWAARGRIGRGPLAAALFFIITLAPALGFVNFYPMIYSFVADHFQYLAGIGLIALFASAAATWRDSGPARRRWFNAGAAAVLALLAALTWKQARIYRDVYSLWGDTLSKNPGAWIAHNNLGTQMVIDGRREEAIAHFDAAVELKPDHEKAHYNLGIVYAQMGRVQEAIAHYSEAIRIDPENPESRNNLGNVLAENGDLGSAIAQFREALSIDPQYAEAHNNLGLALSEKKQFDEAMKHFDEALRINPRMAEVHNNAGVLLARQKKIAEAAAAFQKAVELRPDYADAHGNLGRALFDLGDLAGAIFHYREVLRLDPNRRDAQKGLEKARNKADGGG